MGFRLPRAPGCHLLASAEENCRTARGRPSPSEHCNEEVIDYFGRCVEPAAQADAILSTRTAIAFMAEGRGRSITAGDSLVRRLWRPARPPIGQSLGRREGNARADASRSRGNGGTRRRASDDDKGSAGNDCAGASRRSGGFGVEANTHFFSSHLKDQCRLPCDAQKREQNRSGPVCTISML
jgi:hypothetical protein